MVKIKNVLLLISVYCLIVSCNSTQKKHSIIELSNKIVINKELSFCDILNSLSDTVSSVPYDTYRGTPYLHIEKESSKLFTTFKYYEKYPKYDEFGSMNGGKITLSRLIFFEDISNSRITVMSINDTINIDTNSKLVNKYDKYFIINFNDYFKEDPFYLDKIDFEIKINKDYNSKDPVMVGVYWDDLSDYYKEKKCDNGID